MPPVDTLEAEYDALDELVWELGGLALDVTVDGDEGFDDVGEIDGDDQEANLDGMVPGELRLSSREVQVTTGIATGGPGVDDFDTAHESFAATLQSLREVMAPLPDRTAMRILRFRRLGEVAKRIYVRPSRGRPLTVPGDEARLKFGSTDQIMLRLNAPDPIIYSDVLHTETFTANETIQIDNLGSLTSRLLVWSVEAAGTVTITHEDYPDEEITFPSSGAVTVSRTPGTVTPEIDADGTYGLAHGPGSSLFPRWPLLRPGPNNITASAACTFAWRDTW